jgi:hypothetical protein
LQDLNDMQYFAQVVRHGGFSAASRATGEPKSKLSKRVARLERNLGVRLIEAGGYAGAVSTMTLVPVRSPSLPRSVLTVVSATWRNVLA